MLKHSKHIHPMSYNLDNTQTGNTTLLLVEHNIPSYLKDGYQEDRARLSPNNALISVVTSKYSAKKLAAAVSYVQKGRRGRV